MVGGGDIDSMSCPEPSPHKEQRDNSIRGVGEEKDKTQMVAGRRIRKAFREDVATHEDGTR